MRQPIMFRHFAVAHYKCATTAIIISPTIRTEYLRDARAIGDRPRNFEPLPNDDIRSDSNLQTRASTDLLCFSPSRRWVFSVTRTRTDDSTKTMMTLSSEPCVVFADSYNMR
ncbi:hypothetical protein TNCV_2389661 [Trichonephila clavipes]|nr:hypothetical protein TNCV_2389661 [Trichonephila clavipes]